MSLGWPSLRQTTETSFISLGFSVRQLSSLGVAIFAPFCYQDVKTFAWQKNENEHGQ
jgi:hypothetical protein